MPCFTATVLVGSTSCPKSLPPPGEPARGAAGSGSAQSSSEKAKSSTISSSPWASCSRSERESAWGLLLRARREPRGAALSSSGGGRRERCKSCCTGAGGGNSSLINARHSLIYQWCCSSQQQGVLQGEFCRESTGADRRAKSLLCLFLPLVSQALTCWSSSLLHCTLCACVLCGKAGQGCSAWS